MKPDFSQFYTTRTVNGTTIYDIPDMNTFLTEEQFNKVCELAETEYAYLSQFPTKVVHQPCYDKSTFTHFIYQIEDYIEYIQGTILIAYFNERLNDLFEDPLDIFDKVETPFDLSGTFQFLLPPTQAGSSYCVSSDLLPFLQPRLKDYFYALLLKIDPEVDIGAVPYFIQWAKTLKGHELINPRKPLPQWLEDALEKPTELPPE